MSYENPDPLTDILVQCHNKLCDWKRQPKWISPTLLMAPNERIICGGCGHETRFIGPNRPDYSLTDLDNINGNIPLIDFEEDDEQ